ncbi:Caffeine resistance protein 5 [Beauveria bassiana]|uniref:Caffeine resistance protein 5 n=1 Tax=Beauveria bassiana TaxID=176275 RepID=A0A2N6NSB7_BEABA|nr:Caffeine resistance protein 5 [Beauveria bassiana]
MESLNIILRDSVCGRLLNHLSNERLFSYHVSQTLKIEDGPSQDPQQRIMVAFVGPDDSDIPHNWPTLARMVAGFNVMLLNFSFYAASAIFTPSILGIQEAFQATTAEGTLGLSLFVIAYGIGPLILSPLSSLPTLGRSPVYVLGSLAFCLLNIGTALAKNIQTVLVLRFLGGFVGSAPISVGGASLMEIYKPTEVPYAIALYAVSGVCGPILGPKALEILDSNTLALVWYHGFHHRVDLFSSTRDLILEYSSTTSKAPSRTDGKLYLSE